MPGNSRSFTEDIKLNQELDMWCIISPWPGLMCNEIFFHSFRHLKIVWLLRYQKTLSYKFVPKFIEYKLLRPQINKESLLVASKINKTSKCKESKGWIKLQKPSNMVSAWKTIIICVKGRYHHLTFFPVVHMAIETEMLSQIAKEQLSKDFSEEKVNNSRKKTSAAVHHNPKCFEALMKKWYNSSSCIIFYTKQNACLNSNVNGSPFPSVMSRHCFCFCFLMRLSLCLKVTKVQKQK